LPSISRAWAERKAHKVSWHAARAHAYASRSIRRIRRLVSAEVGAYRRASPLACQELALTRRWIHYSLSLAEGETHAKQEPTFLHIRALKSIAMHHRLIPRLIKGTWLPVKWLIQQPALNCFTKLCNRTILDHLNMIYFFTHDGGRLFQAKFFYET